MKAKSTNNSFIIHNILIIYLMFFCLFRILLAIKNGYAVMFGDEISYWQISQSLFEQGKALIRNVPVDLFSCFYSWSISWVHLFQNYDVQYLAAYTMNALMMSSFLIPFYLLCCRMFKQNGQALILTILVSMMPEFSYNARIITENLFFPISMWTFYCAYRVFESESTDYRKAILLGLLSFLCFGTRSAGICMFLAMCTYFIWSMIFEPARKKNALSFLYSTGIFLFLYIVFTRIYNMLNPEIAVENIYYLAFLQAFDLHNFLYWIQGGLRYLLIFVIITGIFSLALPVSYFFKLEKQDKRFLVFTLSVLAWAIMESVGMYYISEGMDRLHIRYVSYIIPAVLALFAKTCALLKQYNEKLTKGRITFLCIYCFLGLCIAAVCGIFFKAGSQIDAVSAPYLVINHELLRGLNDRSHYKLIIVTLIALFIIVNFVFLLRGKYRTVLLVTLGCFAFAQIGNSNISYTQAKMTKLNYVIEDTEYKQIDQYLLNSVKSNAKVAFLNENYAGQAIEIHLSARNLSVIPLNQCLPLVEETGTLKDNLIPYVGLLEQGELGEIPDYIIMRKSLLEKVSIASYKQVYETDNYLILKKEEELFRFNSLSL